MARSAGYTVENNFINGLITEATGLNFPENAVTETDNCVFKPEGNYTRRFGIDRETNYQEHTNSEINQATSEYVWESVAGDGNITFLVQQVGSTLYFFNSQGLSAISSSLIGTVSLYSASTDNSNIPNNPCQFATGLGKLVVTHPYSNPLFIEYNKTNGTFNVGLITIQTRDFKGVEPQESSRLSSITNTHQYNLINQGWSLGRQTDYYGKAGFYPSDFEVWWLYKSPDAQGTEVFLTDVAVNSGILNNLDRGNSPAPKGSIILTEFYQDRSGVTGVSSIPVVTSGTNRPTTCAFHAGRAFYAGVNHHEYSSKIYFSQIIETINQAGKCYQQNDPTAQYSSDLLATDGGVIAIPEAGTVYKLWAIDNSLLVFASTGVWQITGSSGIGFSAIDYTVRKISSVQSISGRSFVSVNGSPVWWGLDSIYGAATDPTGNISVQSLSDDRIKTFYNELPELSKVYAKGYYNTKDQVVQWLYRGDSPTDLSQYYSYNRILNLNTKTKAFYPWSFPYAGVVLRGIVSIKSLGSTEVDVAVTDNLNAVVTDNLLNTVTVSEFVNSSISSQFKYLINYSGSTWTYANVDDIYDDWTSFGITPAISPRAYSVGGYKLRGNAIKKAQSNYLRVFARDNSTVKFNSRWDYSTSGNTGRWPQSQTLTFDTQDFEYVSRRPKIRGNGLAFQYVFESVGSNGFDLIGWSSFDTVNERI